FCAHDMPPGSLNGPVKLTIARTSELSHRRTLLLSHYISGAPNGCYGKSVSAADIKKPPGWRLAVIFVAFLHLSVFL
ncbi:hypothetical protein, partial [Klebsiella oxytoca]|uniref:hypothetical protein n=1 Tax=Klebsiella oxytoca TaxID=571 RepID=UPI002FF279A2